MSQLPNDKTDKISSADSRSFDAIRLLANYMIVLMHAWAASQYCAEGTIEFSVWNYLCNSFAAAAMPALFLMSGYLLMVNFTPQVVRGKFYRRLKRLLVPLLAWNLFFVVFYLTLSRFVPRISARVASFNLETVCGVVNKVIGLIDRPLDAPLWYLKTVFIYSLFAIPVWWVLQKRKWYFLYLISLLVLVASVFTPLGQPMKYSFPAYSVFAFLMGCHLGYKKVSVFKMFSGKIWVICPLIGSVIVYAWLVATRGQYEIWRDIGFILIRRIACDRHHAVRIVIRILVCIPIDRVVVGTYGIILQHPDVIIRIICRFHDQDFRLNGRIEWLRSGIIRPCHLRCSGIITATGYFYCAESLFRTVCNRLPENNIHAIR